VPRLPTADPRAEALALVAEHRGMTTAERARRLRALCRLASRQLATMAADKRARALEQVPRSPAAVRWWIDWVASCRR
jgi:hypothetical protein